MRISRWVVTDQTKNQRKVLGLRLQQEQRCLWWHVTLQDAARMPVGKGAVPTEHGLTTNKNVELHKGLPKWHGGKESACQCIRHGRCRCDPWVGKVPWGRKWQPTPVCLPGQSQGQWSLAEYSPWGHKESDRTGWLSTHSKIGCCY